MGGKIIHIIELRIWNVEFGLRSWLFPKGGKAIGRTSCDVELFNVKLVGFADYQLFYVE